MSKAFIARFVIQRKLRFLHLLKIGEIDKHASRQRYDVIVSEQQVDCFVGEELNASKARAQLISIALHCDAWIATVSSGTIGSSFIGAVHRAASSTDQLLRLRASSREQQQQQQRRKLGQESSHFHVHACKGSGKCSGKREMTIARGGG